MERWFYTRAGVQAGPVDLTALQALADQGELSAGDRVWHDGMTDWQPAGNVAELKVTAQPTVVGYLGTGLPARAATTLRGYAAPTGDTSAWPLDDREIGELAMASKHRRAIRRAVGLYRGISALGVVLTMLLVLLMVFPLGPIPGFGSPELLGTFLITLVTTIVCAYGAWATHRNQPWGPYSVAIVLIVTMLAQIGESIPSILGSVEAAAVAIITDAVSTAFTLGFLWTTLVAARAITQLRASPAWCQEVLAAGKW